jgi:hypothetical protein
VQVIVLKANTKRFFFFCDDDDLWEEDVEDKKFEEFCLNNENYKINGEMSYGLKLYVKL